MWFQNRLVCGLKRLCLQFATANPLEFATDKEKQDFIRWCNETKQFSWLRGES
jgi:hypothetical protein